MTMPVGDVLRDGTRYLAAAAQVSNSTLQGDAKHAPAHLHHPHDALLYLVLALTVGTGMLHLMTLPILHKLGLPYTVVLFVLGFVCTIVQTTFEGTESLGMLGVSYSMWMEIDPHLLIFTMLPVLLTGDAMAIDTSVAKQVAGQCLWLAGPGVLLSSFATAAFLSAYLKWPFLLSLCMGSVLSATDPVAVVGLLKELGASPRLTVQIQGESLLNDGTAMVLFYIAYDMLKGAEYDPKQVFFFLLYMIAGSLLLGAVLGTMFSTWIRAAGNRLQHDSCIIQISLSVCCAYGTFVISEGVIGISGVLCTVAAALVLADSIWPKVVQQHSMHDVWHMFEYLGNTVIFFLAGGLTGKSILSTDSSDWLHLLVIYVMLMVIRFSVIFASKPLLGFLSSDGTPVSWQECTVMTWGGLRGAVGLALAIRMQVEKADGALSDRDADRCLFFTGGVAALTLVINATSCPLVVKKLGITDTPGARARVMGLLGAKMLQNAEVHDEPVAATLRTVLAEVQPHDSESGGFSRKISVQDEVDQDTRKHLVDEFMKAKAAFKISMLKSENLKQFSFNQDSLTVQQAGVLCRQVQQQSADRSMLRSLNTAFIGLVKADVWAQINRGEFIDGSAAPDLLLKCTTMARQRADEGLFDFFYLTELLGGTKQQEAEADVDAEFGRQVSGTSNLSSGSNHLGRNLSSSRLGLEVEDKTCVGKVRKIVESVPFNATVVCMVVINAVLIFVGSGSTKTTRLVFMGIDGTFLVGYTIEFAMKLFAYRRKYFKSGWNLLDFVCIILGAFGLVVGALTEAGVVSEGAISSELLLIRLGRVFKILRLMRVLLLVKFLRKLRAKYQSKKISSSLAHSMEVFLTLRGFVLAHQNAQVKFLQFLAPAEGLSVEQAYCLLESLTHMYKAMSLGAAEIENIDSEGDWILGGLSTVRDSSKVSERLMHLVLEAAESGMVTEREAETLVHPLLRFLKKANTMMSDSHAGIHEHAIKKMASFSERSSSKENITEFGVLDDEGDRHKSHLQAAAESAEEGHKLVSALVQDEDSDCTMCEEV
eukprot:TRINITY_DN16249_c0_g2_i1.p1 TRINITY_DN16249_c0_g2~~TRINITY_DN16249_c0_g2_i1.p1  ORF type:complete len:1046 (-),score=213.54 TRINITY_DN16249_c0_g2_i1:188-3325(-)